MKYIFVAGAPGSKWSMVAYDIYSSGSVDRSDHNESRLFRPAFLPDNNMRPDSQMRKSFHSGSYFDPGFEFSIPEYLSTWSKEDCEKTFNMPFDESGTGYRIIKSHIFCYPENIEFLKQNWPDSPIVLVSRDNQSCMHWWTGLGGFSIAYPCYQSYYQNLERMQELIQKQNAGIEFAISHYDATHVQNSHQLCNLLGLDLPTGDHARVMSVYKEQDVEVTII